MLISETEKKLLKKNKLIVGTANAGVDNYIGPIVSCSIVLNYDLLSCFIFDILDGKELDRKELESLVKSFQFSNFYFLEPKILNDIRDTGTAEYMANFNSVNKIVWSMLKKRVVPDAFVTAERDLKEVIKSSIDSVHSTSSNVSEYVVWNKPPSLNMLVPKAEFVKVDTDSTLVTRLAKALAQKALDKRLKEISAECPKYDVLNNLKGTQAKFVKKYGNTMYHRLYLNPLYKYPINTLIFNTKLQR